MIEVLYFAGLREKLGLSAEKVATLKDVAALMALLRARGGVWAEALVADKRWRVAVNQELATLSTLLKAGDEVAIFPPVTGG